MKAVVIKQFGAPEVFELSDIESPEIKEDELLIEVEAGSVNPVDWKQRKGNHSFLFGSKFPIVLGYDIAGKVIKTGLQATKFKEGDYVCGVLPTNSYGKGLAQFVKGTEKCFSKVDASADAFKFAILPLAGLTSLQALRDKGNIKRGSKILIIGAAGGVGHYAVQIAQIYEAEIFAVSSEKHKKFLDGLAKTNFIDYHKQDILKLKERFDIIYDGVGKYSFLKCKHLLISGGIYINTLPRPKILIHKALSRLTRRKRVKGILMKHNPTDLNQLVKWVKEDRIKLCTDKEFSIREVAKAHAYSEEGHAEGKILIRYNW